MKTKLLTTILTLIVTSNVWASTVLLSGVLTSSGGGLVGTADWSDNVILTYQVTEFDSGDYRYDYNLTVPNKDISHVISQTCESLTFQCGESNFYSGYDPSNPNLPQAFYGVKFEASGKSFSWSLTVPNPPTEGHFYAKNGKTCGVDVTVWSDGLSDGDGYIPVPSCFQVVPEPSSGILLSFLSAFLFKRNRCPA